jgi:hypothetical protein
MRYQHPCWAQIKVTVCHVDNPADHVKFPPIALTAGENIADETVAK